VSSHLLEEKYKYYSLGEEEKEAVLSRIREVLEKHDVKLAIIFGSFLNGDVFRDIDIAIYSEKLNLDELLKLGVELELGLGIPVDLAPLDNLPPKFRLNILRRGIIITEKPGIYEYLYMRAQDELILMKSQSTKKSSRNKA